MQALGSNWKPIYASIRRPNSATAFAPNVQRTVWDRLSSRIVKKPRESGVCPMARETFQIGDLTAVIGDKQAYEGHRAGYKGGDPRTPPPKPNSLFSVKGLN